MEKLRFEFILLPSNDGKSNIYAINSITTMENKTFAIPEELRSASYHTGIIKTNTFAKVKKSLVKRYQIRRVWITLTEELKNIYIDEDGNVQFNDQFLEELSQEELIPIQKKEETHTLEKLLTKLIKSSAPENRPQNLKNIAERFVLEKFTNRNMNANKWINTFERECIRFDIETDEEKIEMLRLFMDKSCADWYSSMMIKLTIDAEWSIWKNKFCESFASKGWSPVTNALFYKYKEGSLLDYAIRKEKLLLEMRESIDIGTMVDLIAAGLPEFILNRIDRETIQDTVGLFNEVSRYEHMLNKKRYVQKNKYGNIKTNRKNEEYTPCKICEKLNKGIRFHDEEKCWFKQSDNYYENKINYNKNVNNTILDVELSDNEQKNE